ncbi:Uncharacterized protein SCF082_LOCUS2064 [Durusdinium trenchii]|uniref:Uncharacterized protein n=1 Tax=Durusdinium trenchii TaxID=1381693 RepID=A0ABP0HIE5_9DINO
MLDEIAKMQAPGGFDFVIICCSDLSAENYWQERLSQTIREVTGTSSNVICVHEDWPGGAGNGLGTLYAFVKACSKGEKLGLNLAKSLHEGKAVAIYHTAGKGTRLAPLPGAENNNKPGVKLPGLLSVNGSLEPITVLECVLRQTSSYGAVRGGRCSVFWGDQIFVPSCGIKSSNYPADILAALRPMPTKAQWESEALHQYGLIAVDAKGDAMQLEKVTYDVAMQYLPSGVQQVGTSLGSFSISAHLMDALLSEFAPELASKSGSLDSDPHFWMPLTLKKADYRAVMGKKGTAASDADKHFDRMAAFQSRFGAEGGLLGCVDVGQQAYWWDYGRLELYMKNNYLLTESSASAYALRRFLCLETDRSQKQQWNSLEHVEVDPTAVVLNCRIGSGRIGPGSVLVNVVAPKVDVEMCILVKVSSAVPIFGKGGLLYNVVEERSSDLPCDNVRADVFMPGGVHHKVYSTPSTDGGKVWKEKLSSNSYSFEGIYKANQPLDVLRCTEEAQTAHENVGNKVMPVSSMKSLQVGLYSCCVARGCI